MDNPTERYIGFTHQCNLYSVYPDGTARSWHGTEFVRRDDGKWTLANGYHIAPALQTEFQKAYRSLVGQVAS